MDEQEEGMQELEAVDDKQEKIFSGHSRQTACINSQWLGQWAQTWEGSQQIKFQHGEDELGTESHPKDEQPLAIVIC